jgi:hypothetical protein
MPGAPQSSQPTGRGAVVARAVWQTGGPHHAEWAPQPVALVRRPVMQQPVDCETSGACGGRPDAARCLGCQAGGHKAEELLLPAAKLLLVHAAAVVHACLGCEHSPPFEPSRECRCRPGRAFKYCMVVWPGTVAVASSSANVLPALPRAGCMPVRERCCRQWGVLMRTGGGREACTRGVEGGSRWVGKTRCGFTLVAHGGM